MGVDLFQSCYFPIFSYNVYACKAQQNYCKIATLNRFLTVSTKFVSKYIEKLNFFVLTRIVWWLFERGLSTSKPTLKSLFLAGLTRQFFLDTNLTWKKPNLKTVFRLRDCNVVRSRPRSRLFHRSPDQLKVVYRPVSSKL